MKKRGLENCKAGMTQKTGFPIGSGMTENKYDSRGRKIEEKDTRRKRGQVLKYKNFLWSSKALYEGRT
jgi:hypothetical protein